MMNLISNERITHEQSVLSIFCPSAWQKVKMLMISNAEGAIKKQTFSFNMEEVYILKPSVCKGEAILQELSQF